MIAPKVVTVADMPETPPCCALAHEQGYRRGYRDGYRYALWDLGRAIAPLSARTWEQCTTFLATTLFPWVHRAFHAETLDRECGPRLTVRRKGVSRKEE